MKKAIIFDLDGTLLNTLEDLRSAVNAALAKRGLPPRTLEEVRTFVGNGIRNLMQRSLPQGTSDEEIDAALADFRAYYYQHLCDATMPYEGIPEMIDELARRGVHMAVLSNKVDEASKELMEHFFPKRFALVFGERKGIPRKPNPMSCMEVMQRLKVKPEEVLYVGDSGVDMQTAQNAGLYGVGVTWGFRSREVLQENGAKTLIDRPEQLLELV